MKPIETRRARSSAAAEVVEMLAIAFPDSIARDFIGCGADHLGGFRTRGPHSKALARNALPWHGRAHRAANSHNTSAPGLWVGRGVARLFFPPPKRGVWRAEMTRDLHYSGDPPDCLLGHDPWPLVRRTR